MLLQAFDFLLFREESSPEVVSMTPAVSPLHMVGRARNGVI